MYMSFQIFSKIRVPKLGVWFICECLLYASVYDSYFIMFFFFGGGGGGLLILTSGLPRIFLRAQPWVVRI